jgi:murein DD-endopeptidase MepM/ murein hydrolase activator NlpD
MANDSGKRALLAFILLAVSVTAHADYPLVSSLTAADPVFRQLQQDLNDGYKAEATGNPHKNLTVYSYRLPGDTELFALAALANIPYDSIATLNRYSSVPVLKKGMVLLLPGTPGVFLPRKPANDIEYLMASWRPESPAPSLAVEIELKSSPTAFYFYPGSRFSAEERAFFLSVLFRFPLPVRRITSDFGVRISPITGKRSMHTGIDLAAPKGTPIHPAREGVVIQTGYSEVYGNFVLLQHSGGWQSLYGHMNSVAVRLNDRVGYAMILGTVGSTGESTGPHLHFEIRNGGVPRDPASLMPTR